MPTIPVETYTITSDRPYPSSNLPRINIPASGNDIKIVITEPTSSDRDVRFAEMSSNDSPRWTVTNRSFLLETPGFSFELLNKTFVFIFPSCFQEISTRIAGL